MAVGAISEDFLGQYSVFQNTQTFKSLLFLAISSSTECQQADWKSGHNSKCKDFVRLNSAQNSKSNFGLKASGVGSRTFSGIALVPATGSTKLFKKPREVYVVTELLVLLFSWVPLGLVK